MYKVSHNLHKLFLLKVTYMYVIVVESFRGMQCVIIITPPVMYKGCISHIAAIGAGGHWGLLGWKQCIMGLLQRDQKVFLRGDEPSKTSDKNGGLF